MRPIHRTAVAAVIGLLAVIGLVTTASGTAQQPARQDAELAAAEFDDEAAQRALVEMWGLEDIAVVPRALRAAAQQTPQAYGGMSYAPESLTYTVWVVPGAPGSEDIRARTTQAFSTVADGSNIRLKFGETRISSEHADRVEKEILNAYHTDTKWPSKLSLSGEYLANRGGFLLEAGELATDPAVVSYFKSKWGDDVILSTSNPSAPEAENRRADSPSNGYNGGLAICPYESTTQCVPGSDPDLDLTWCTGGFKWNFGGVPYLLTAGHCLDDPPGSGNWYRYATPRYSVGVASTVNELFSSGVLDAGIVRSSARTYRNWIWIDGKFGEREREITGSDYSLEEGEAIWFSAGNSGWQSGTIANDRGSWCNGMRTRSIDGVISQDGDSGSPYVKYNVESPESGDYLALGVHVCGTGADLTTGWRKMTTVADVNAELGGYAWN